MESQFFLELNHNRAHVEENLEEWINTFRNQIGSVRKICRIKTLYDLIDALERCDAFIKTSYVCSYFQTKNEISFHNENIYSNVRLQNNYTCPIIKKDNRNENNFLKYKQIIYKLIAREIGSSWRSFGRELNISQGVMDEIVIRYPYDLKSQVYKVLETFEENESHNAKEHAFNICRALEECRRKDLRRKVENILTNS